MVVASWIGVFALGAAMLARAGVELARSGDEIAMRTGVGGMTVGAVLVASATSLPEVLTAVSAAVADAPDVAVGNLFGSSMANVAILAIVDLFHHGRVWPRVELGHARIGSIAIGLTAAASFALVAPDLPSIGWVGLDTAGIAAAYLAAVAWVRRSPSQTRDDTGVLPSPTGWGESDLRVPGLGVTGTSAGVPDSTLRRIVVRFMLGGLAVLVAAPLVALSAREIAASTGVEETVVGVVLVAISTSLPELIASVAAVRIGAHDLAVGNLLGSNCVNMAVLVLVDVAYTPGPILGAVADAQTVAAVGAIVLMSLALAAIVHGEETKLQRLEPDAVLLLLAYVAMIAATVVTGH